MPTRRQKMCVALTPRPVNTAWRCRTVRREDRLALAQLMLEAYRGTIDGDDAETLEVAEEEIDRTFAGAYGEFLPSCSWLIEEEDRAVPSACLVTYFEEWHAPIIAFVMTGPEAKGRGMAKELISRSMNAALALGYRQLCLAVTEGNTPAERAYVALGFEVTERWER